MSMSSDMDCAHHSAVSADLIRGAKDKHLKVKGPVRLPTKVRHAAVTQCHTHNARNSALFTASMQMCARVWSCAPETRHL